MNIDELEDWTLTLDREIAGLRDRLSGNELDTTMVVLDTSFAELHAASSELRAQQNHMERVLQEEARTRRRHETLFELLADAVIETDEFGTIRESNEFGARLLGVRPDFIADKPLILFIAEDDRMVLSNAIRAMARGESVRGWELSIQPRGGSPFSAMLSGERLDGTETPAILWLIRAASGSLTSQDQSSVEPEFGSQESAIHELDGHIQDRLAGMRKLSRRVIELQDLEGQKLARELRERFGQALGAIRHNLESLERAMPEVSRAPLHVETMRLVDAALQRLREIYFELSPPLADGLSLVAMIRQLAARVPDPARLRVTIEADPLPSLAPAVEAAALWVTREALSNIVRHSDASIAEITVRREGSRLNLSIVDNGRGFDQPAARGMAERAGYFGILGMEERVTILGGDIQVISAPRKGTRIQATFSAAFAAEASV